MANKKQQQQVRRTRYLGICCVIANLLRRKWCRLVRTIEPQPS